MRKTVLILLFLGLVSGLHAKPITSQRALEVANVVFGSQTYTKAAQGDLHIVWDGEFEATKTTSAPDFYVVGRDGGGFVIVAGDDSLYPVLGFSMENTFLTEGMPCNAEALMRAIKRYCQINRRKTESPHAQWDRFITTKANLDERLISDEFLASRTVCWNQADPANLLCPIATGQKDRSVCGCTSLSFAETMTWFGFPERGEGTVVSYTYETDYEKSPGVKYTHTIPAHDLGTVYDWEGLQSLKTPRQFYAETNTELGMNLAQLTYDIGTILQASYNDLGTWCGVRYMNSRLCVMMKYNKGARELSVSDYPWVIWLDMLKEEVTRHPVITSGWGHSYVADGYAIFNKKDLVFHYNIGWGGSCNGYYYADIQNVDNDPTVDYHNVNAIYDFYPDPSGTSEPYSLTRICYYEERAWNWDTHAGIYLHPESNPIESDQWFLLAGNGILNAGTESVDGELAAFRVNASGLRDEMPLATLPLSLEPGYVSGGWAWWMQAPVKMSFGDRFVWYFNNDGGDYQPIKSYWTGSFIDELPVFPAAMIKTEDYYAVGDYFYFELINNDYTYSKAVWNVTSPSGMSNQYQQSDKVVKLTEKGTYTIKVYTGVENIVSTIIVN